MCSLDLFEVRTENKHRDWLLESMMMPGVLKNWVDLVSAFALPTAFERTSSPNVAPPPGSVRRIVPAVTVRSARLPP